MLAWYMKNNQRVESCQECSRQWRIVLPYIVLCLTHLPTWRVLQWVRSGFSIICIFVHVWVYIIGSFIICMCVWGGGQGANIAHQNECAKKFTSHVRRRWPLYCKTQKYTWASKHLFDASGCKSLDGHITRLLWTIDITRWLWSFKGEPNQAIMKPSG